MELRIYSVLVTALLSTFYVVIHLLWHRNRVKHSFLLERTLVRFDVQGFRPRDEPHSYL